MVGNYGQDTSKDSHGFLYSNGTFTYFDYPGQTVTVPTGINDSGLIVGYYGQFSVYGFLYDGTTFTTLQDGSNTATYTDGINNAGDVVGGAGSIFATKGFELHNGHYRTLNVPGQYVYVYGAGINNVGQIVGWTDNDGFVCRHGRCQIMNFPGASKTEAEGLNDSGVIVGWYYGACACGFALKNGKYVSFRYPTSIFTGATGINASGQIVGQYQLPDYTYHGFVTSPITDADFERSGCCQTVADETGH